MTLKPLLAVFIAFAIATAPCRAQGLVDDWRAAALQDLRAAHLLLAQNHPAMAVELGDRRFIRAENTALRHARALASRVDSAGGYWAVLALYTNALGDPHVAVRPSALPERVRWPQFAVSRTGGRYMVSVSQISELINGDILISCDGQAAERFAQETLGRFAGDWRFEAQRMRHASLLLVDSGNPFVTYPERCRFRRDGRVFGTVLRWREIEIRALARVMAPAAPTARDLGLREAAPGILWITLPSLDSAAGAFVESLELRASELRAASHVVVDLRGNRGGNSRIGDRLAEIVGLELINSAAAEVDPSVHWRASIGNAQAVADFARSPDLSESRRASFLSEAGEIRAAAQRGDLFWPPLPHPIPQAAGAGPPPADAAARIVVVTDFRCFSSCLMVVDAFRRAGAFHAGAETDYSTRYMEARSVRLPSGAATISFVQKAALHRPYLLGPFAPAARFDGDIGDTDALEVWLENILSTENGPTEPVLTSAN